MVGLVTAPQRSRVMHPDTDFFAVAGRQRACRSFTDEDVDDAVIAQLLHTATRAPSSENTQPWRFVVVRNAATRAAIGSLIREIWEAGGRRRTEKRADPTLFRDVDRGLGGGELAAAPVLIVVGGDSGVSHRAHLGSSVFPAVQNLMLGATALGLGSCLTTITSLRSDEMRALVGFPPEIDPIAVIPIGHAARPLLPPRREPLESKVYGERFGESWPMEPKGAVEPRGPR
jgi:nitroreductase